MTPWKTFTDGLPASPRPRRVHPVRLVCFDMDGVLVEQESSWVAVHDHYGLNNEESLHAFLRGEIDDAEFIRRDVALWMKEHPGISLAHLEDILGKLHLMRGAKTVVRRLHKEGVKTAIVSGGIDVAAKRVASALGILHVSANELHADGKGRLTGTGTAHTPLRDKSVPVRRFAKELGFPLGQVASVGNSSPDIAMFRASGLAIAFKPTDEFVQKEADHVVVGPSLTGILPALLGRR